MVEAVALGAPEADGRKRKRAHDDWEQKLDRIARMNQMGMTTNTIAEVENISEAEVVSSLLKRRRSAAADASNSEADGPDMSGAAEEGDDSNSGSEKESEAILSLVTRLTTDPTELCCPILHMLMEDPVVAEDGITYEREGIESALNIRQASPTTNQPIGRRILPNQSMKSQVIDHKEKTIAEIVSVVPRLPQGDAAKLLRRAEDFIRPKLPDSGACARLLQVLKLRVELPCNLRGDSVKELLQKLLDGQDNCELIKLLSRFESLGIGSIIPSFDVEAVKTLLSLAQTSDRVDNATKSILGHEVVCKLAARAVDKHTCQELWQVVHQLNSLQYASVSDEVAGIAMAALFGKLELEPSIASDQVIEIAVRFMQDKNALKIKALEFFKSSLGVDADATGTAISVDLAKLFVEMANRQKAKAIELEKQIKQANEQLDARRALSNMQIVHSSLHWDISHYDYTNTTVGDVLKSDRFIIAGSGQEAWLEFYPKGDRSSSENKAALFLYTSAEAIISFSLALDGALVSSRQDAIITTRGGWANYFKRAEKYKLIKLHVKRIARKDSHLTCVSDA